MLPIERASGKSRKVSQRERGGTAEGYSREAGGCDMPATDYGEVAQSAKLKAQCLVKRLRGGCFAGTRGILRLAWWNQAEDLAGAVVVMLFPVLDLHVTAIEDVERAVGPDFRIDGPFQ